MMFIRAKRRNDPGQRRRTVDFLSMLSAFGKSELQSRLVRASIGWWMCRDTGPRRNPSILEHV